MPLSRILGLSVAMVTAFGAASAHAAIILTDSTPYTQNFASVGAGSNNSSTDFSGTLPADWTFSNTNGFFTSDGTGTPSTPTNSSKLLSAGASGSSERALGIAYRGVSTNTVGRFGASFVNNGTTDIESLAISYSGEQWRTGGNAGFNPDRVDPATLVFEYSLDATSLTTGTWTGVTQLDFTSILDQVSNAALNGNSDTYSEDLSAIINVALPVGDTLWIRWTRTSNSFTGTADAGGSLTQSTNTAHFLAVDDFSLTASFEQGIPEPASLGVLGLGASLLLRRRRR